nr:unnamed protein product [Digitaria exilis]
MWAVAASRRRLVYISPPHLGSPPLPLPLSASRSTAGERVGWVGGLGRVCVSPLEKKVPQNPSRLAVAWPGLSNPKVVWVGLALRLPPQPTTASRCPWPFLCVKTPWREEALPPPPPCFPQDWPQSSPPSSPTKPVSEHGYVQYVEHNTRGFCSVRPSPPQVALADGDSSSSSWDSDDEYQKLVEKMNPPRVTIDNATCANATIIHVDSANKYGILLEVVQVLTDLKLIVKKAYISSDGGWFMDERLGRIKERLRNVFKGRSRDAKTTVAMGIIHRERRLHQMMLEDRDYERYDKDSAKANPMPMVSVVNWLQKDYSVVTMRCNDRPKLLFDTVCTLTDMQYVVYHGSVDTEGPEAYQEYYIRHIDGSPVNSEAERKRIIQYLEAAIERRVSEGLKLELSTGDRVGLLSDVTRIFRENGLTVTRAEVSTKGNKAVNTFYVRDTAGSSVELKALEAIRQEIGQTVLQVKGHPEHQKSPAQDSPTRFLFSSLFRPRTP